MANFTHARLVALVKRFIGNRDDLDTEVSEAIDASYLRCAATRGVTFAELDTIKTNAVTVAGTRRYSFETFIGAGLGRDVLAIIGPLRDVTNKRALHRHSFAHFDEMDQSTNGKPIWFDHFSTGIELHPTPDGVYTIQIRYRKRPVKLSIASSASVLPEEYDMAIVYGAATIVNGIAGRLTVADWCDNKRIQVLTEIAGSQEIEDAWQDFSLAPDLR